MTTRICRPKTTPSYPPPILGRPVNVLTTAGLWSPIQAIKVADTSAYTNPFTGTSGAPSGLVLSQAGGTGGTMALVGDKFRMATSATAYHTLRGILPAASWSGTNCRATIFFTTAATAATNLLPQIMLRTSGSWDGIEPDSPITGYKLVLNGTNVELYERHAAVTTKIGASIPFTVAPSTTYGMTLQCLGTQISGRIWNASSAEPPGWQIDQPNSAIQTPGQFMMAFVTTTAAIRQIDWDNLTITNLTGGGPTGAATRIGVTWTGYRPSASMNSTIAVHETQAQHIIGFGTDENPANELNPSLGVYNWSAFDPYFDQIIAAGATKPIIIFCRAPGWMKAAPNITQDDLTIVPAHRNNYATLCRDVALRYNGTGGRPNVQYFSFWNEMKGYHIPHRTNEAAAFASYEARYGTAQPSGTIGNHWDFVRYTQDYNAVWAAVKAVRPTVKIGGPYVILQSGRTGYNWSHGPSALNFPGGSHDARQMQVMEYFVQNATGFDFLSCDGGIGNQFPKDANGNPALPDVWVDPYLQMQKLWGWWVYVRSLSSLRAAAGTCELINFETYVNEAGGAPWGYSETQKEDLFIELCRQTQINVPNPNVSYLTWFSPGYRPAVVNQVNAFVWANTPTGYGPKVANWHATGV